MTIAREVTSAQSGWVVDPNLYNSAADDIVWRYGTERPCNLVGRYITIFADYSEVAKPFQIALCQFGVMGSEIPVLDEVQEEVIEDIEVIEAESVSSVSVEDIE